MRQFHGYEVGLALSLRTLAPDGMSLQRHLYIVPVYAMQSVSHGMLPASPFLQLRQQASPLQVRHVFEPYHLPSARDSLMEVLEDGREPFHVLPAPAEHVIRLGIHLLLPHQHQVVVGFFIALEQGVPLLQCLVVSGEAFDIGTVVLCNRKVHEPASLLTAARD